MDIQDASRVVYICGKCGKDVQLEAKDIVRCQCGYRILYKKKGRSKESPQYEAI